MAGVEREAGRGQEPTLVVVVRCGGAKGAGCRRAGGEGSVRVESRDGPSSLCVFRGENECSVWVESRERRRPGGRVAGSRAPEGALQLFGDSRRPAGFHCCLGECLVIISWFVLLWSFVG